MPSAPKFPLQTAAALIATLVVLSARADILTLTPAADGYIRASQSAAQANNIANSIFFIADTASTADYLRGVLAFDLSDPALAGATINGASLVLTIESRDTAGGGSANSLQAVNLHALSASFDEAAVTWTSRDGANAWSAPGGDFGSLLASASANPATAVPGDTLTFAGSALASTVSGAIGGSCFLLGKLAIEDATRSVFRFASRTGASAPRLVIDYTPAVPNSSSVTPLPGHPEQPASPRYTLAADGRPVQVKAERFDFDVAMFALGESPVVVEITVAGSFSNYTLKPTRHGIAVARNGNTLRFTLSAPHDLVLQIPDLAPLAIIVTPPESNPPLPGDSGVIYFGPGTTVAGVIRPASNQTIYLAPGALVKGRIEAKNVSNVAVRGRGFLETEGYAVRNDKTHGILVENAADVTVEGIAVRNYNTYWQTLFLNSRNVTLADLNLFGVGGNTDGVDIDAVKDFVVRDSFIRAEDDGLGWHSLDAANNGESITERVLADNLVIWNTLAGNGVRIGASMEAQLWRDITLRNLDILQHAGSGLYSDYSDWAWMKNLRFENVVIERNASPIHFRILKTIYTNSTGFLDERGHFEGLVFENVIMNGGNINLHGFDATHRIDQVRFNNCTNAGVPITSAAQLILNPYVTNIAFNQPPAAGAAALPGIYEAEDLESRTNKVPQYIVDDPASGQGSRRVFRATAPGAYLEHTLDVPAAGTYALKIRVRQTPASGRAQLTANGVAVGGERDFYAATEAYQEIDCGLVTLPAPGPLSLRLAITGRNSASSGHRLELDAFKLLTPLQAWRDQYFQTTANLGSAADSADPDDDSTPNLLEFATGMSPVASQPADVTAALDPAGGQLGLTFSRLFPAPVAYIVEASGNLEDWTQVATLAAGADLWSGPAVIDETAAGPGIRRVILMDPDASAPRRFLRLRVKVP